MTNKKPVKMKVSNPIGDNNNDNDSPDSPGSDSQTSSKPTSRQHSPNNNETRPSSSSSSSSCHYQQFKHAIRRDLVFLLMGMIAACIVSYVETNAWDVKTRWNPGGYTTTNNNNNNDDNVIVALNYHLNSHSNLDVGHSDFDSDAEVKFEDKDDDDDVHKSCDNYDLNLLLEAKNNDNRTEEKNSIENSHQGKSNNNNCPTSPAPRSSSSRTTRTTSTITKTKTSPPKPIMTTPTTKTTGIIDAGFLLTNPLHNYLSHHRHINDVLALINSLCLIVPFLYVVYVTLWNGDFTCAFRLIWVHLFRSLCGWFTYLPPDPQFLPSYYDFPEIFLCLFQNCSHATNHSHHCTSTTTIVPFVTFFSGHIASTIIIANHLYIHNHTLLSTCLHGFNWLQVLRLLATRGHYSIDLIVGYVVAVFVSSFADRWGWCYSRGIQPRLPMGMVETWEVLIGVGVVNLDDNYYYDHSNGDVGRNREKREVTAMKCFQVEGHGSSEMLQVNQEMKQYKNQVRSKTSVRVAVDIVTEYALRRESFWSEKKD